MVDEELDESFQARSELEGEVGISLGELGEVEGVFSQRKLLVLDDRLYQLESTVTVRHLLNLVKGVRFLKN